MREDAKMGFVADARERLIRAGWRQIVRDIRAGHARELERAGLFDRMRIEARIREEIRTALDRLAPPGACY